MSDASAATMRRSSASFPTFLVASTTCWRVMRPEPVEGCALSLSKGRIRRTSTSSAHSVQSSSRSKRGTLQLGQLRAPGGAQIE